MARRWPDNVAYQERYIYASLLTGLELETSIGKAIKLYEARPRDSKRKLLMALAYYRMKNTDQSLRVMQNTNLPDFTSAGEGAVFCGIMRASNENLATLAKKILAQVSEKDLMLPEEQRFLDIARR
jgi:hypothetical protein